MSETTLLKKLLLAELTPVQEERLFTLIAKRFTQAIDKRSPKNRPPGKAGLRAEKSYYRLLYLEGEYHAKIKDHQSADTGDPTYDWGLISFILQKLKDIPELQSEIIEGIAAALMEVADKEAG